MLYFYWKYDCLMLILLENLRRYSFGKIVYNIVNKIILKSIALFKALMYNEVRKRLLIFHFIYIYS